MKNSNVNKVQKLLNQGANPNYKPTSSQSLMHMAIMRNQVEIIKLLVRYGINVDNLLINYTFQSENIPNPEELVFQIIKYNKDIKLKKSIF